MFLLCKFFFLLQFSRLLKIDFKKALQQTSLLDNGMTTTTLSRRRRKEEEGCNKTTKTKTKRYAIGIDGGTGGIRCHLFDCTTGQSVRAVERTYDTTYGVPRAGCATQICDAWVERMCDATRELLHLEEGKITIDDIAAMCVDTTCCSVVFMDDDGTSLYPCIMWCDMRAGAKETKDVLAQAKKKNETTRVRRRSVMGMAKTIRVNCDGEGPVSAEWMVPKALWMKRHEREVFDRATRVCEYQDYMNFRLVLQAVLIFKLYYKQPVEMRGF